MQAYLLYYHDYSWYNFDTVYGFWSRIKPNAKSRQVMHVIPKYAGGGRFAIIKHGEVATATQSVKLEDLKLKPLVFKNFQKIMGKWEQYPNVSANLTIFQASHMYCFHSLMAT
jgi:hypothetical protein